jgi:hypothetical protein
VGQATVAVSDTGRQVRENRITQAGRKQLDLERTHYRRVSAAITAILETA